MKKQLGYFKILIMILVFFSLECVQAMAETDGQFLTRAAAAKQIAGAADDYNQNMSEKDIMKGYEDGSKREQQLITKVEAYVMITRAFRPYPQPIGDLKRRGVFIEDSQHLKQNKSEENNLLADLPFWADKELTELSKAGLLTEGEVTDAPLTKAELNLMIKRVYAYFGSNLKDDAYNTINRSWLLKTEIPQGAANQSVFAQLEQKNEERLHNLIEMCCESKSPKGSAEQKIAALYQSYLEEKPREKAGLKPLKKYFRSIERAKTVDELLKIDATYEEVFGTSFLFPWFVTADAKNSAINRLALNGQISLISTSEFLSGQEDLQKSYRSLFQNILQMAGEKEDKAGQHAQSVYKMERVIAEVSLREQELNDVSKTYHPYSQKQLIRLFADCNLSQTLAQRGLNSADKIIVMDEKAVQKSSEFMTNEHLETLKSKMKIYAVLTSADLLSSDCSQLIEEFQQCAYGISGEKTKEEKAVNLVANTFDAQLGKLYIDRYFSAQAKKNVESMVSQCIKVYEKKLMENDWMSEQTKAMAVKKLQGIQVKIGYPEQWDHTLDKVSISSKGKDLWKNMTAINKTLLAKSKDSIDQPVRLEEWETPVYIVNAYYMPTRNEIVFPAGILQAPFYDENQKSAANWGGIGTVIAHEITHAFDNHGARYDEKGNANNWWTDKDFAEFNARCEKVRLFYDGVEAAPGITNDGNKTLSENVADLGGVSCALKALEENGTSGQINGQIKQSDYRLFFESFLQLWARTMPREMLLFYRNTDVHALAAIRANQTVKNFQTFYDSFQISEGDGMYVEPEKRVTVW